MQLGMVGLGKMGLNMSARLLERDHQVVVFDLDAGARARAADLGAMAASDIEALVSYTFE